MLGMAAGVRLHPILKALIAVALIAVGLTRHHAVGLVAIGAGLLAWAAIDALSRIKGGT
jgi:hypothetical protein